jgi:hypothetical protein
MKKSPAKTHKNRRPSKASLAEIPEIDFSKASVRKNPYASRKRASSSRWAAVDLGRSKRSDLGIG